MKLDTNGTVRERMERYTIPEPMSGCHLWIGAPTTEGYGNIWANGRPRKAHRVAWSLAKGEIPAGQLVLHKCDNPPCVNVDHLYLGDDLMNARDRIVRGRHYNHKKTHCPEGHEYTVANTYVHKRQSGCCRICRTCAVARTRAYVARAKRSGKEIQV